MGFSLQDDCWYYLTDFASVVQAQAALSQEAEQPSKRHQAGSFLDVAPLPDIAVTLPMAMEESPPAMLTTV